MILMNRVCNDDDDGGDNDDEYSEVTLRTNTGHTLISANLKAEVFHPV